MYKFAIKFKSVCVRQTQREESMIKIATAWFLNVMASLKNYWNSK